MQIDTSPSRPRPPFLTSRARRIGLLALLLMLGFSTLPGASQAEGEGPFVTVLPLGANPVPGHLVAIGPGGLTLRPTRGEATPQTLPLDGIRSLRFTPPESPARNGAHWRAHLIGGDVAVGQIASAAEETLTMRLPAVDSLPLSFEVIRTLEFVPADAGVCHDNASRRPRRTDEDLAYLKGGDRFVGLLAVADAQGATFEDDNERKRTFAWTDLDVVHLANELLEIEAGLRATVELWNGTRLLTKGVPILRDNKLSFTLASAPKVEVNIALAHVASIAFRGGRFVHASDLAFEASYTPFYPVPEEGVEGRLAELRQRWWAVRADRRPDGCPLSVGGIIYRKGFAAHSGSVIRLPLNGRFSRFEGAFGMDDAALRDGAGKGHVHARILADGKEVWKAENVVGGTALKRIANIDVKGVKQLELRVDYGEQNNFKDRASWIEPILVK